MFADTVVNTSNLTDGVMGVANLQEQGKRLFLFFLISIKSIHWGLSGNQNQSGSGFHKK